MTGKFEPKNNNYFAELELQKLASADNKGAKLSEGPGFSGTVHVSKGGDVSIIWTLRYYSPELKKKREIGCGTWAEGGAVKMRDVRARRDRYKLDVKNGIDPKTREDADRLGHARLLHEEQEAAQAREAERAAALDDLKTVSDLFGSYVESLNHKDDGELIKGTYRRYIEKPLGAVLVKELTEKQVVDVLRRIVRDGKNRTAEMAHDYLVAAFTWAEKRTPWRRLLVDGNPLDLVDITKILDRNYTGTRERVLAREEITELDTVFHKTRTDYENAPAGSKYAHERPVDLSVECAAWIALATLCRIGELTLAEWKDVNLERREWFIPRENVKATGGKHKAHSIYLSDLALGAMKRLKQIAGHTPFLFPNKKGDAPRNEREITRRISDNQLMFQKGLKSQKKQTNMLVLSKGVRGKWTPHDLRRTGSTIMEMLEINPNAIDRCQNHLPVEKLKGSRRHYLLYKYDKEMKDAWIALNAYLAPLVPHAMAAAAALNSK